MEYYERESVQKAIMLSGQLLKGHPVVVQASQADKNLAWQQEKQRQAADPTAGLGPIPRHTRRAEPIPLARFSPLRRPSAATTERTACVATARVLGDLTTGRSAAAVLCAVPMGNMPLKLYVGSLHFNITEDDLKKVLCPHASTWSRVLGVTSECLPCSPNRRVCARLAARTGAEVCVRA